MNASIALPGGGTTTPLGIGLATLMREPSRRRQQQLLRAAYEAGYRHFDVAPSYGLGAAERVLGDFLRTRPAGVTVGTKVGIRVRSNAGLVRTLERPARAILRRFPALRGRATRAVGGAVHVPPDFAIASCERSLAESRRALGLEQLDLLLLHEATAADLADGEAVEWIQEQRRRGLVRAIGVATSATAAREIVAAHPRVFDVIQTPSNVLTPAVESVSGLVPLIVTHSVVALPLARAMVRLGADPDWGPRLSEVAGIDAMSPGAIARLLLAWALDENRHGVVLLGSSSEGHIRSAPAAIGALDRQRAHAAATFLRETLHD